MEPPDFTYIKNDGNFLYIRDGIDLCISGTSHQRFYSITSTTSMYAGDVSTTSGHAQCRRSVYLDITPGHDQFLRSTCPYVLPTIPECDHLTGGHVGIVPVSDRTVSEKRQSYRWEQTAPESDQIQSVEYPEFGTSRKSVSRGRTILNQKYLEFVRRRKMWIYKRVYPKIQEIV